MGTGRLSQGIDKLQVWAAVKTAYGSLWLHKRRLAGWAVVPLVLTVAIELALQPYLVDLDRMASGAPGFEWMPGAIAAGQLRDILFVAVWTGFELSLYRLFLLGSAAALPAPRWRSIYASLLIFGLALLALINVPTLAFDYARIVGGVGALQFFDLVYGLFYGFLAVRLAFVAPAICLGWPWELRQRWAETRGNFWRLFLAIMLAMVPVLALAAAFLLLEFDISSYERSAGQLAVAEPAARAFVTLFAELSIVAVTVAAVAQLTGHSASGLTGHGPSAAEIAARFD